MILRQKSSCFRSCSDRLKLHLWLKVTSHRILARREACATSLGSLVSALRSG